MVSALGSIRHPLFIYRIDEAVSGLTEILGAYIYVL